MSRTNGYYWVRERAEGTPIIARFEIDHWSFGDGDEIADEAGLDVIGERLTPPAGGQTADWQARYDKLVQARKAAGEKDPLLGWDYLPGYYWVRVGADAEPVLAQYLEGWAEAAGEEEFDHVTIIDGPVIPPLVTKRHVA
jgi:hypothetical protein